MDLWFALVASTNFVSIHLFLPVLAILYCFALQIIEELSPELCMWSVCAHLHLALPAHGVSQPTAY